LIIEFDLRQRTTNAKERPAHLFSSALSSSHNFNFHIFSLSQLLQTIMFASYACRFAIFSFLSLSSANAETVRGAQRELSATPATATVELRSASTFAILAKTGISTVPASSITGGDIGVSPIAADAMTGFSFTGEGGLRSSSQVAAQSMAIAADDGGDIESRLTTAVGDMETAYTDAAGRPNTDGARINLGGGKLADVTLTPGVYTFDTDVNLNGDITFAGSADDIFIIQTTGNLLQAAGYSVILSEGALAKNIFWQVAGQVTVGAGSHMEGVLLVKTAVTFVTGSSLNGRVLTQTACNLQSATITASISQ
jgi:hypothetical protein